MENIIFYLIEYGVYLLCFYILYLLVFKGKSDHSFNRFYLLSSNLICLTLPLVNNSIFLAQPEIFAAVISPIEIVANGTSALITETNKSLPLSSIIVISYLIATALFLARFIYGLFKIKAYKIGSSISNYKNYSLIESDKVSTPFSFFNNIYLPKGRYEKEERDLILRHELSHIQFGHSWEKLFLLLNKVFFWWNPISYKYFTELELIHEYQVDEKLCHSSSKKHYGAFLLSQINMQSQYSFVNNISSHIKNRIIMISSKRKETPSLIKWGSYLTMFFAIMFLHACNIDSDEPLIQDNYEAPTETKSDISFIEDVQDTVFTFDTVTKKEMTKVVTYKDEVFNKPDVMPIFGDCVSIADVDERYQCSEMNLLTFIYKNIEYPKEAKDAGIQGMSVVRFVVNDKGNIRSQKIVRSLDPSTDKAVLAVLKKMQESDMIWTAGRHEGKDISTQFTLPVKFKLE